MSAYASKVSQGLWLEASSGSRTTTFPRISCPLLLPLKRRLRWCVRVAHRFALPFPAAQSSCNRARASARFGFEPGTSLHRRPQASHIVWRPHRFACIFRSGYYCFVAGLSRVVHPGQIAMTLSPFLPLILTVLPATAWPSFSVPSSFYYCLLNSILIFLASGS